MTEKKVTVIGCGLVGGSVCLALKRRHPDWKITALDLAERVPSIAEAGVADVYGSFEDAATHLPQSSFVILATPVEVILDHLESISPHLQKGAIVTDVGGVKTPIMERARKVLPAGVSFIGGHPIAGSEVSGVQSADPLLFKDRAYVLCPYFDTPADSLLFMVDVVEDLLAWPMTIEPEEHDRVMATVSHMPQLLSVALFKAAMEEDKVNGMVEFLAGKGFLGLTRVAASDYGVWRGILQTNRSWIRAALDRLQSSLTELRDKMERDELGELWNQVSQRRREIGLERLPRMRLPEWRRLVDHYDEEILRALAQRIHVASRIGKLKQHRDFPVNDPVRERRMMSERRRWAKTLDLPTDLVDELFALIVNYSRRIQSTAGPREESVEDRSEE